jgi:hypothetical protein
MFSLNTLKHLPVTFALATAVCAFTVPQALAGGTSKDSPPTAPSATKMLARHFQHEDALYAAQRKKRLAVPDAFERYAATHPYGKAAPTPERFGVPPDAFERYAASHPYGVAAPSTPRVSVPLYTPAMLTAHYSREDLLYNPRPSLPTNPDPTTSTGFDWSDWAIGIGTGLGLALILAGGLLIGRQLRHRGIQTA